jgi:UDP-N-acetylglucosamine/UDP-N-acetylgalactosamine diphosphorylase
MISREFVESLTANGTLKLPWHRADKKIPYVDESGNVVTPDAPNGVKLESFIFDALPLAPNTMILEGDRAECFAPTKNATGVDSVESCREMLITRDARRLEAAGVVIPRKADGTPDCMVEIDPAVAIDDDDVKEYVKKHSITSVAKGEKVVFE